MTKCRGCKICNGIACKAELPGMGGVLESSIFIENVKAWKRYYSQIDEKNVQLARLRLAPMAGGIQNVGWHEERDFYFSLIKASHFANLALSIGDGFPDEKLEAGLAAVKSIAKKAAIFLKPFPQDKLFERIEKSKESAEIIGIDVDSYNIITMRSQVSLEKKSKKDLDEIRKKLSVPFAIKGIFSTEDIEMVQEVKPEIAIVSNHGGRIDRQVMSSASFLAQHFSEISPYVSEVWVDGGLRCYKDILVAKMLGAKEVMIGRPIISAMIRGGKQEVKAFVDSLSADS